MRKVKKSKKPHKKQNPTKLENTKSKNQKIQK